MSSLHLGFLKGTRTLYTIEPEHLRTHGLCVGMTGSGKTGLCIALLEELAIAGVPMVLIDPKGDLGNIMLGARTAEQYSMLIPQEQSQAAGIDHEKYSATMAAEWNAARRQDGASDAKVAKLVENTLFQLYTPGGGAGKGLSITSALKRPRVLDVDSGAERAVIVAETLLALVKKTEQTPHARALVAHLLVERWKQGQHMSMPALVDGIMDPPFAQMGGLDVETYYPRVKRLKLAQEFNGVISSPTWQAWLQGDPLDFGALLYQENRPVVTVISIAHLGDQERAFFVALLLNQAVQWMREQPGTEKLRALIYMDEVAGYFPPSQNTPAKRAAMTLIKQGRAFGLGCMFSSQNPVDIDYKMMGNMGLWMIGRLNTERDKARLEEGLEGMVEIPPLGKREFVVRNVHGASAVIRSRNTISYLFGPLSQQIIAAISGGGEVQGKEEIYNERLEQLAIAMQKQKQMVDMLQKEVSFAMGGSLVTVLVSMLFGRRGTAMRQLTRKPPKKAQQLLEARARLQAMQAEYKSVEQLVGRAS